MLRMSTEQKTLTVQLILGIIGIGIAISGFLAKSEFEELKIMVKTSTELTTTHKAYFEFVWDKMKELEDDLEKAKATTSVLEKEHIDLSNKYHNIETQLNSRE